MWLGRSGGDSYGELTILALDKGEDVEEEEEEDCFTTPLALVALGVVRKSSRNCE